MGRNRTLSPILEVDSLGSTPPERFSLPHRRPESRVGYREREEGEDDADVGEEEEEKGVQDRPQTLVEEYLAEIGAQPTPKRIPLRRPPMPVWVAELVNYMQTREPIDEFMAQFNAQIDRLDILNNLGQAKILLERGDDEKARDHASHALGIANRLNHHSYAAKCEYWIDRIDDAYINTQHHSVRSHTAAYLTRSPSPRRSMRPLSPPTPPTFEFQIPGEYVSQSTQTSRPSTPSPEIQPGKRKQDQIAKRVVLRPSIRVHQRASGVGRQRTNALSRPKYWVSKDEEDLDQSESAPHWADSSLATKQTQDWDLKWLAAAQGCSVHPKQSPFTFRAYPSGLGPRWRQINIFPEQEWEFIVPAEKWEEFKETNRGKYYSMEWLAEERLDLLMMAEDKAAARENKE